MTSNPTSTVDLLLVEDDSTLQSLLDEALSEAGFEVICANDGTEGIAKLNTDGARFKAIVTDIRLGCGPNGWDIGHRAREIVSGIPVIYMSGDSAPEWSAHGVPESIMLAKPFITAQLITAVTALLNLASTAAALNSATPHDGNSKPPTD